MLLHGPGQTEGVFLTLPRAVRRAGFVFCVGRYVFRNYLPLGLSLSGHEQRGLKMKIVSIKKGAATGHRHIKAEIVIDWPTRGEVTYLKGANGWNADGIDCSRSWEKDLNAILKRSA